MAEAADHSRKLPDSILQSILTKCEIADIARSACVDRRWHSIVGDDDFWKDLCALQLQLCTPHDHQGNPCPSYQEAYRCWFASLLKFYPLPLVLRTKKVLEFLKSWASSNAQELLESLQPGLSEQKIDQFERKLGWSLPQPVRLLYRFLNGQDTPEDDMDDDAVKHSVGLLGGYCIYDHTVNVYLLSLQLAILLTQHLIRRWGHLEASRKWLIIAASIPLRKFFFLDCSDGSIHVGTRNLDSDGEMMSCVPPSSSMQDAMLRWLEEYCACLNTGMFSIQQTDQARTISLFPEREPLCTEAITCGVQVRCSAVFVPEHSSVQDDGEDKFMFGYLVRMQLLPLGNGPHFCSFRSCQLLRRHWVIRENKILKNEVRGEAVIGLYPLLKPGCEPFKYASCSTSHSPKGSMEGDFTFVPGSINHPEGAEFLVRVASFGLEVPQFIF